MNILTHAWKININLIATIKENFFLFFSLTILGTLSGLPLLGQRLDSLWVVRQKSKYGSIDYLKVIVSLGEYYAKRKVLDSASYYYYIALPIADSLKNSDIKNRIKVGLANGLRMRKEYAKSLRLYLSTLEYYKQQRDTSRIIILYNNIALVYKDQKLYKEAKEYYEKALALHQKLSKNQQWYEQSIMLHNNLSNLYALLGDLPAAQKLLSQALTFCSHVNNPLMEASTYINLSERYLESNLFNEVSVFLNKALIIGKRTQALEVMSESYRLLSLYHEKTQNLLQALNYYKQYDSLNRIILNETKLKQIVDLESKYEIAKKDKELLIKQRELELAEHRQVRNYFLLGILGSFLLVALVGMRNLYLRNKRQQAEKKIVAYELEQALVYQEELKSQIEFQQKELLTATLQKAQQHETITQIKEYVKKSTDATQENIQKIKQLISTTDNVDKDWTEFKLRFEKIHTHFFKNLQEQYPDLTQNDLRMCAFIKLQLDKKQIATLLNITTKAVEVSRYRLKKKLGLDPEADLNKFIQSFE